MNPLDHCNCNHSIPPERRSRKAVPSPRGPPRELRRREWFPRVHDATATKLRHRSADCVASGGAEEKRRARRSDHQSTPQCQSNLPMALPRPARHHVLANCRAFPSHSPEPSSKPPLRNKGFEHLNRHAVPTVANALPLHRSQHDCATMGHPARQRHTAASHTQKKQKGKVRGTLTVAHLATAPERRTLHVPPPPPPSSLEDTVRSPCGGEPSSPFGGISPSPRPCKTRPFPAPDYCATAAPGSSLYKPPPHLTPIPTAPPPRVPSPSSSAGTWGGTTPAFYPQPTPPSPPATVCR